MPDGETSDGIDDDGPARFALGDVNAECETHDGWDLGQENVKSRNG